MLDSLWAQRPRCSGRGFGPVRVAAAVLMGGNSDADGSSGADGSAVMH